MQNITIYDLEADRLERLADKYDTTIAEIVEMMLDNITEDEEDMVFA